MLLSHSRRAHRFLAHAGHGFRYLPRTRGLCFVMRSSADLSLGRLSLEPALFQVSLRYHSVPIERLAEVTTRRLAEAGLPSSCLGRLDDRRVTLTGCVVLPSFARSSLPPSLGGDAMDFAASGPTFDLIDRAVQRSPVRGPAARSPPRPVVGGGAGGGGGGASPPSPIAARARHLRRELVTEESELEREEARYDAAAAAEAAAREALAQVRRDSLRSAAAAAIAVPAVPAATAVPSDAPQAGSAPPSAVLVAAASGVPLAEALAAAATAPRSDAEVQALAAVEEAGAERARCGLSSAERRNRVWDLEETLSALSATPGPPPSPPRSGGGGGSVDLAREQAHLRAAADNMGLASSAIAHLSASRAAYPLIYQALLEASAGEGAVPAALTDLPLLALAPAVLASKMQAHGLGLLRQAARLAVPLADAAGVIAAAAFDDDAFDYHAAEAIATGAVGVEVSPLDICLGVLPLTQLALHFWYANHVFVPGDGSRLLELARATNFAPGGSLDFLPGYSTTFIPVWSKALAADEDMPYADIFFALVQSCTRAIHAAGAERVIVAVNGVPTPWPAFAMAQYRAYQEDSCGHVDGRAAKLPTLGALRLLVRTLNDYNRACILAHPNADKMRPPQIGGVSSSVRRIVDAAAPVAVPASEPAPAPLRARSVAFIDPPAATGTPPRPDSHHSNRKGRGGGRLGDAGRGDGGGGSREGGRDEGGRGPSRPYTTSSRVPASLPPAAVIAPTVPGHGASPAPVGPVPADGSVAPARLPAMALAASEDILSVIHLMRAGWNVRMEDGQEGSHVAFRSSPRRFLIVFRGRSMYLDLVRHLDGWTPFDSVAESHRGLARVPFLLDSGAETAVVRDPLCLADLDVAPPIRVASFSGVTSVSEHTGVLLMYPPAGVVLQPEPWPAPPGVAYSHARRIQLLDSGVALDPLPAWRAPDADTIASLRGAAAVVGRAQDAARLAEDMEVLASLRASLAPDAVVRRLRPSAFPEARDMDVLSAKFNLLTAASATAFVAACPLGVSDGILRTLKPTTVFAQGLASGVMKAPPVHARRHSISRAIREAVPPGHVWFTDISNQREADFRGHTYSRVFADEGTHTAYTCYASRKDAATLLEHLDEMSTWIGQTVPGGQLRVLRCDFASEAVRQGHGDAIYTKALSEWCDRHPGFVVSPVAPHSQAFNRAENTWGRIHGHAHLCARRARVGPTAWSLIERGAVYIHNHTPAPRSGDVASRTVSRFEQLTLQPHDVSTMLGYVGQLGWIHRPEGKDNAYRSSSDPVLYISPASTMHGQLVFNLRNFTIMVVSAVHLSVDPYACSLLLAGGALHRPAGVAGTPPADAYETRLNALLAWSPIADPGATVVKHDPVHGLPTAVVELTPTLSADGQLVMLDLAAPAPVFDSDSDSDTVGSGDSSDSDSDGEADAAMGAGGGAALPGVPLRDVPPWARMDLAVARDLVDSVVRDPSTPLRFRPDARKNPGSASAARFVLYRDAQSLGAFRALHATAPSGPSWRADLINDLQKGLVALSPPVPPVRVGAIKGVTAVTDSWRPSLDGLSRVLAAARDGGWRAIRRLWNAPPAPAPVPMVSMLRPALWPATCAALEAIESLATVAVARVAPPGVGACLAEAAEIRRLDALEPSPMQGVAPIGPVTPPAPPGEDLTQTTAFADGVRVLRISLVEDYTGMPALDEPGPTPAAWGGAVPPHLAFMATPDRLAPVAPASVSAARRDPDFGAEFGWFTAIAKEISRVEGFDAWELASARQVRADRALYGEHRVSIGYIVAVLTCKLDPAGDPREPGILKKFRVAIADAAGAASGVQTHSNCADDVTNRIITAVAKAIKAEMDSIDISGAYFHGIPLSMLLGGRRLYVRIPQWLSDLFPAKYPQRGPHGACFLLIKGNMPGRCDAGRIWQQRFDTFLRGFGLTQLLTDRRVWIRHTPAGQLILHDHVDDTRITASCAAVREEFHRAWAAEFRETIVIRPLSEDFTGLRHTPIGPRTVAISCGGVIRRLETILRDHPLAEGVRCNWPLATISLARLMEGPSSTNVLVPHLLHAMQIILGTIGFIVGLVRADGYFAYCVLVRHLTEARLTQCAADAIVRLGHYLVRTKDLSLHITTPDLEPSATGGTCLNLFDCFSDSSHGNGDDGASIGGFILASRADPEPCIDPSPAGAPIAGGGALAWRCGIQHEGDDSSAAAELRMATLAYKYTVAARFLLTELDVGVAPSRPTRFYLDAQAVLDGTTCERLAKKSRWMAMRYAMLRWGIMCGTIQPLKRPSARNPSDGLTKCLTGAPFENARARLLGLVLPHPHL